MSSKIEAVVVCCFPRDLHLARICIASVRHWYPDIPILLLKDETHGTFSTVDMETYHNVGLLERKYKAGGWGLTKLEALFGETPRRILLLDSDTVMLGPVIELLESSTADFVVTGEKIADPHHRLIKRDYIDVAKTRDQFDPKYQYPGFGFNSGHIVVTRNLLTRDDFTGIVNFSDFGFKTTAPQGLFPYADQGILNYVLARKRSDGVQTEYRDFWCWSDLERSNDFDISKIRNGPGYPEIMHWAGTKRFFISKMRRSDILSYFNKEYYRKLPRGRLTYMRHEMTRCRDKLFVTAIHRFKGLLPTKFRQSLLWQRLRHLLIQKERWRPWPSTENAVLARAFQKLPQDATLLQVGAHDGATGDPIHRHIRESRIPSIHVEPVPELFKKLQATYRDVPSAKLFNCAASTAAGTRQFYLVDTHRGNYPEYFNQLGSFDRSVVEKQARDYPDIHQDIRSIDVPCMTPDQILETAGFDRATVVQTDTEGFDLDILEQIDFDKWKTRVVMFEHAHLSQSRYKKFLKQLNIKGFKAYSCGADTVATREVSGSLGA